MTSSAIAVVGMAGRFPGAPNVHVFWRNLRDGRESIRTLSNEELIAAGVSNAELDSPHYVKAAAILDDVPNFDASFFGFSPRDAAIMDPQHRHFLECAWEALEDSGHVPQGFEGSIGVFAGSGPSGYLIHNLLRNQRLMDSAGLFLIRQTGNDKDVLATRVSYQFDLRGPSVAVQTACSTSLVAVHLACQSLLNGECDLALAGGVTIEIPHHRGYLYREGEILSRDGHCRAFDASCSGTVFSSGVGLVVLRRLEDALRDHDTIHAIVRGSAVNNDGRRKAGFLAPSVAGQAEVIAEALGVADVRADTISYVEAHGTGTLIGDPIEIKALTQAFRQHTTRTQYCALGSLKTNIGHLDAAAGVAGLIKTVLALRNRQIPASLNFRTPNPEIDFEGSPFYLNERLTAWEAGSEPRRACVTSLGIGGTNAHLVLEEANGVAVERQPPLRPFQLLPLSAKTSSALEQAALRLSVHLEEHPSLPLADVAFTLQAGRQPFRHRRIVVAGDVVEAARMLAEPAKGHGELGVTETDNPPSVVFLFSGQGSQYLKMAAGIYSTEPTFRAVLDECAEHLAPLVGVDIRNVLFPQVDDSRTADDLLNQTRITQPALVSLEYSLAQWWMGHGVHPRAMVGHSIGEFVAACLSGVLSLEDALSITALRGQLMQECASGAMLAVALPAAEVRLPNELAIAAVNSPRQCVVSGPIGPVEMMERDLKSNGVMCQRLRTSHAFHSAMMDPILDMFGARMKQLKLHPPKIPFLSNLTGTWITAAEATDAGYWVAHLRNTVRFSACVAELLREHRGFHLEIGPGRTLASLVREHLDDVKSHARVLSSLRRAEETVHDAKFLQTTLGQLWLGGHAIDWSVCHEQESVSRVSLPTYPFERQRCWIDPDGSTPELTKSQALAPLAASAPRPNSSLDQYKWQRWFHQRRWSRVAPAEIESIPPFRWLVFLDPLGVGRQIAIQLRGAQQDVVEVAMGQAYSRLRSDHYAIRPGQRHEYDLLLNDLARRGWHPQRVVHLWSIWERSTTCSLEERLDRSFYSLAFLAQALGEQDSAEIRITAISDCMHAVGGQPSHDPVAATMLGPLRVIPKEIPYITCRNIDVEAGMHSAGQLAVEIIAELCATDAESVVALRNGERWIEDITSIELQASEQHQHLRRNGVYLITGGLGGLGMVIAGTLAREYSARLILLSRTPFPEKQEWQDALTATATPLLVKRQLQKLLEIDSLGGEVLVVQCDVTRADDLRRVIQLASSAFGAIDGVIHAAGVLDDGPLMLKTQERMGLVLAPKVQGTIAIIEAFQGIPLEFVVLFSSISSESAPAGQIDYVAANSFLDAFATADVGYHIVSINWERWRDVGMGAQDSSSHPMLGSRLVDTENETILSLFLAVESQWVLADHRWKSGRAIVPGTCYLDLARAALSRGSVDQAVEFSDVFFLAPLFVDSDNQREARLELQLESGDKYQFSVRGRDSEWIEHATGHVSRITQPPPPRQNVTQILSRCQSRVVEFDDRHRTKQEHFFEFGPRWRALRRIHVGPSEAIAVVELPDAFASDVIEYASHPALFDLATGAALYLIENYDPLDAVYFPLSYRRIRIFRPFPAKIQSHIRRRGDSVAGGDVAMFDITLLGPAGEVIAEIEAFAMRLVRDPLRTIDADRAAPTPPSSTGDSENVSQQGGILPADGACAFTHILSSDFPNRVLILPDGLRALRAPSSVASNTRTRTASSNGDLESQLVEWWQELLGIEAVSLDDDFLDLGGHSLVVARLFAKVKKAYGVDLGLSKLFEARTVRKLSRLIRDAQSNRRPDLHASPAIVAIQPDGTKPRLFVISGLGGNVIKFHSLASRLGRDFPMYGLLPRGLDGREPFHTRVEDMAEYYVNAIIGLQPTGPYCVVGYSFGGAVAFEVARQLVARNGSIGLLGMFDTIEWRYMERVGKSLGVRGRFAALKAQHDGGDFQEHPARVIGKRLRAKLTKSVSRVMSSLGRKLPVKSDNIEEINAIAGANYRPKVFPGRLTLFRSVNRGPLDGDDEYLGWGGLAAEGIEVHHVPSTHFTILQEPAVTSLAEKLRECLNRVTPADSGQD